MSIRLMSVVWDLDLPSGEKLVLLSLADQANDEGRQCWPSVETIMRRSGQGERTVRRAIAVLEEKGHLTRHHRTGTSTQYHVHPCQIGTPVKAAPLPNTTETPAKLAPKPPVTTITPTKTTSSTEKRASKSRFHLPADIPADEWRDFEEMRRTIRKPMTDSVRAKAIARLRKLEADGWPPGEVLSHSTLNNYQGLFPPKDTNDGNRAQRRVDGQPDLRGSRPDPSLSLLRTARAAEAEEAAGPAGGWEDYRGTWPALPSRGIC